MTITLELAGLRMALRSVGGVETCIQIPWLDLCLDIGRCPRGAERHRNLLLTHAHIDHAAGLPYYVSMRGLMNLKPPHVWCPKSCEEPLRKILDTWASLQADSDRLTLTGIAPGDRIDLPKGTFATVFSAPHRIDAVGFTIFQTKRKLKPELAGLPTEEIGARARAGEEVNTTETFPLLCFPGDTRIEVVEEEETVRTARILILECTFVGDKVTPQKARRTGHVHLDQVAERADLFENEHVVLSHFSRRHSADEIRDEAARILPKSLMDRVTLLIHDD
jgi:ribonuclease Z